MQYLIISIRLRQAQLDKGGITKLKNYKNLLKTINSNVRLSLSKALIAKLVSINLRQAQLDNSRITYLKNYKNLLKITKIQLLVICNISCGFFI